MEGSVQLGLRLDRITEPSAVRAILGFACNQGFVFLFYLGANRAFGEGSSLSSAPICF